MLVRPLAGVLSVAGTGMLAEPAVEIALAVGRVTRRARRWAETSASLQHWLALIDVADPQRRGGPAGLAHVEELAARGRLGGETLHRLATVLDALDIDVPAGIWDAASRTPQPAAGYLPETGVLAELAQSAKRKDTGRTILLAMRALGPDGAGGRQHPGARRCGPRA